MTTLQSAGTTVPPTMTGFVLDPATGPQLRTNLPVPTLAPGEALVRVAHGLQTATPIVDQYQHAENYWNSLLAAQFVATDELLNERDQILSQRNKDTSSENDNVLCHRDLTPLNVIEGNCGLYLLDWEYAARGAATFDFASIAVEWNVPSDTLVANFQLNRGELERAQALYRYTCHLWDALDQLPM